MKRPIYQLFFIFFWITTNSFCQQRKTNTVYDFSCEAGFYQLINNQLHLLSTNGKGSICWAPIAPAFNYTLSALAYNVEDGFMYSFDTASCELLRIYASGAVQPLGIPIGENHHELLDAKLTKGAIIDGVFCAYAPQEDRLYWVNIETRKFTKTYNLFYGAFTNIAYHSTKHLLYSIGKGSRIQYLDPKTKEITIGKKMIDLPLAGSSSTGNTWMTKDGRLFVTRKSGTYFAELNEEEGMSYPYRNTIEKTFGDGTNCPLAKVPAFIQEDVLDLSLDLPQQDRVMLRWIGVHEYNNAQYLLEHSINRKDWVQFTQKPSIGLNNYANPYGARMPYEKGEDNYYRLKKNYKDGSLVYSPTVMLLEKKSEAMLMLSPKIVFENISLSLYANAYKGEDLIVVVKNSYNQVKYTKKYAVLTDEETFGLETSKWLTGIYQIEIISSKGLIKEWIWVQ